MSEKEPPNVIYLQWAPDGETTWCQDKINADDVRYIREWADKHEKQDNQRFLWGGIAIIVLAGASGVIPQILALIKP